VELIISFVQQKTAEEQVDNFLQVVKKVLEPGDLPPVLDVEPWPKEVGEAWKNLAFKDRINRVKTWLEKVEQATEKNPLSIPIPPFGENICVTLKNLQIILCGWLTLYPSLNLMSLLITGEATVTQFGNIQKAAE
jgi:hypothetical protein